MAKKSSGNTSNSANEAVKSEHPLQAVVLADSFTRSFRPMTLEKPKVLLPLAGVPMLEYTLEFLAESGVAEIFVFCCNYAEMVEKYLQESRWNTSTRPQVKPIKFPTTTNAGDALREIDSMGLVRSDPFVLVSGDVVSNIKLGPVLSAHKERRRKNKECIMTLVFKRTPGICAGVRTIGEDLVVALNSETKQILRYEDSTKESRLVFADTSIFDEHPSVEIRYDLMDCHIDICSPEMLLQIADNYDYQDLRKDYLHNEVQNLDLGYQIFAHELTSSTDYAARVHCFRTYDAITKDVIRRWTHPLVPDSNWALHDSTFRFKRGFIYSEDNIGIERKSRIGENSILSRGCKIGSDTIIVNSVIGRRCVIGDGVKIENSYLWDDVVVGDGASIQYSIVCDRVKIGKGAIVSRGNVLSFDVVIGDNHRVPEFSRVTRTLPSSVYDPSREFGEFSSEDEDEDEDEDETTIDRITGTDRTEEKAVVRDDPKVVGPDGRGAPYYPHEEEPDVLLETPSWAKETILKMPGNPTYAICSSALGIFELEAARAELWENFPDDLDSDAGDGFEGHDFFDTDGRFIRGVSDIMTQSNEIVHDNMILEIKSYKYAENRTTSNCVTAMVPAILAPIDSLESTSEIKDKAIERLEAWKQTLEKFLGGPDEQSAFFDILELIFLYGTSQSARIVFEAYRTPDFRYPPPTSTKPMQSAYAHVLAYVMSTMFDDESDSSPEIDITSWLAQRENDDARPSDVFKADLTQTVISTLIRSSDEEDDDDDEVED